MDYFIEGFLNPQRGHGAYKVLNWTKFNVSPLPTKTVICMHFHYPSGWKARDPLPQKDIQMIEKAKDLNAKYIRFDIWWKDVEPQKDQFNENAFEYYRAIINKIHQEGMDEIVVLGSSGGW